MTLKKIAGLKTLMAGMAALLISGCMSVDYVGQRYEPTENIAWFNDKSEVPPDLYRMIGKISLTAPDGYNSDEIRQKLMKEARGVGADAVEIVDAERRATGQYFTASGERPTMQATGMNANNSWQPDGSRTSVNSFGQTETNGQESITQYEMIVRAYFLRLSSKFAKEEVKTPAAPVKKKDEGIPLQLIEPEKPAAAPARKKDEGIPLQPIEPEKPAAAPAKPVAAPTSTAPVQDRK